MLGTVSMFGGRRDGHDYLPAVAVVPVKFQGILQRVLQATLPC